MKEKRISIFNEESGHERKKKILLTDKYYDIKPLTIPSVEKKHIKSLIINTLRKELSVELTESDIDYEVVSVENKMMNLVVFIKHFSQEIMEHHTISFIYHYLEKLVESEFFSDNAKFLIKEDTAYYLYHFRDGIFKKRNIYYKNDLGYLGDAKIYFLEIGTNSVRSKSDDSRFIPIPDEIVEEGLAFRSKPVFEVEKGNLLETVSNISLAFSILMIIILLVVMMVNRDEAKKISDKIREIEGRYMKVSETINVNDKVLNRYIGLKDKQNKVMDLYTAIYSAGYDNLTITTISITGNKFRIDGECANDSLLEKEFRTLSIWKYIRFNFTKNMNTIGCVIEGEVREEI